MIAALAALAGPVAPAWSAQPQRPAKAAPADAAAREVDRLLEPWNKPGSPGAAVAVMRDGRIVYKRGVGLADVEHNIPITPATPFHVASVSKQFTAFAIHLLAQEGKLSLEDDVRKYLPELPDFGKPITVGHLLHHTSGLRDQWGLLAMAGWRLEDVITDDDVLRLVLRQRALNFEPGQEFLYSNTGYTLLALIVKRVSGEALPSFAHKRIFAPLGMNHTHFHDNYGSLVTGRARSYGPSTAGNFYEYVALSYSSVGPSSLFTTVEDLAAWDRNFEDGRVGGKAMLAEMLKPGLLGSDKPAPYASGLLPGKYRGLETIWHNGSDAGYRSMLMRFPAQHFTVAVLANAADLDTAKLARQIADIYLAGQLAPRPPEASPKPLPTEVQLDPSRLDALVGEFRLSPQFALKITKQNDRLVLQATGQEAHPLYASGERAFFLKVVDAQLTFDPPGPDGIVGGVVLHQNGRDLAGKRTAATVQDPASLMPYAGEYYSDELHVLYTVAVKDGKLVLSYPRGELALEPVATHAFATQFPIGRVEFDCRPGESCSGFHVSNGRVRKLAFSRVAMPADRLAANGGAGRAGE